MANGNGKLTQSTEIKRLVSLVTKAKTKRQRNLIIGDLFDLLLDIQPDDNAKKAVETLLGILKKIGLSLEEQQDILLELDIEGQDRFLIINKSEMGKLFKNIKNDIKVDVPAPRVNVEAPNITVTPTKVNLPAPIVNIPETRLPDVNIDLDSVVEAIEDSLEKLRSNDVNNPLAVRLSDGEEWINQLIAAVNGASQTFGSYQGQVGLKNYKGKTINPATSEDFNPPSTIGSGTTTITTAGTAVQLTATSTPCKYVMIASDEDNSGGLAAVGDANVVAAAGSQRGILLPGPTPRRIDIDNVNKLYVDAQSNGDKVCYAYFN